MSCFSWKPVHSCSTSSSTGSLASCAHKEGATARPPTGHVSPVWWIDPELICGCMCESLASPILCSHPPISSSIHPSMLLTWNTSCPALSQTTCSLSSPVSARWMVRASPARRLPNGSTWRSMRERGGG